jgi:hypothetical protein
MINQPRLFERSFAADDKKDSFAIDSGISSTAGDNNCFFVGYLENTPGVCQAACFAAPNKIGRLSVNACSFTREAARRLPPCTDRFSVRWPRETWCRA